MEIDDRPITVSIWCLTYNHEKYIRQCLDGFVMQKTNFRFEANVHDDASTDGTADIVREYAEKYPDIIKPIIETENQYSKQDRALDRIMEKSCIGKFVALCEGDDYWIDPLKLQKQVDFLESHPDYSFCVHETYTFNQNKGEIFYKKHKIIEQYPDGFSFDKHYHRWITQPLTLMYSSRTLKSTRYFECKIARDVTLLFFLKKAGKGFLMPDIMSVYRVHNGGVCSGVPYIRFFRENIMYYDEIFLVDGSDDIKNDYYVLLDDNLYNLVILREWEFLLNLLKKSFEIVGFWKTVSLCFMMIFHLIKWANDCIKRKVSRALD